MYDFFVPYTTPNSTFSMLYAACLSGFVRLLDLVGVSMIKVTKN